MSELNLTNCHFIYSPIMGYKYRPFNMRLKSFSSPHYLFLKFSLILNFKYFKNFILICIKFSVQFWEFKIFTTAVFQNGFSGLI